MRLSLEKNLSQLVSMYKVNVNLPVKCCQNRNKSKKVVKVKRNPCLGYKITRQVTHNFCLEYGT